MTIHQDVSRPPIYEDDGKVYYRASALGGCINELVLFRRGELGEDKSAYIEKVLEAGNEYEAAVRAHVAQQLDLTVVSHEDPVEWEVAPGFFVTGNTDGRLNNGHGLEIKTLGPDSFKNFVRSGLEKFPEYQWQLSVYMHAVGLPWLYAAAERSREEVDGEYEFYVDVNSTKILAPITEPPIPVERIRRKIRRVETLAQMEIEELPQCEKTKFCSMVRFHELIGGNIEAEAAEEVKPGDELYELLLRRQQLHDHQKMLDAERKELDREILQKHLEGPATVKGKGRWVPVLAKGNERVDKNQLRIDLGDEFEKYVTEGSPYSYIRFFEEKT